MHTPQYQVSALSGVTSFQWDPNRSEVRTWRLYCALEATSDLYLPLEFVGDQSAPASYVALDLFSVFGAVLRNYITIPLIALHHATRPVNFPIVRGPIILCLMLHCRF